MQHHVLQVKTATISTGSSVMSTALKTGGFPTWAEIPTFAVGITTATAQVYCQVSDTSTTSTFRRVVDDKTANADFWVTTSTIGNFQVKLPNTGWQWTRLEVSNAATATLSPVFRVVGD
jgi:hypothetical protein